MKDTISQSAAIVAGSVHSVADFSSTELCDVIRIQARKLIKSGLFQEHMQNDLEQELSLILLAEEGRFDSKRSNFLTFSKNVLRRRTWNLARTAFADMGGNKVEIISLDASINAECEVLGDHIDSDSVRIMTGVQNRSKSDMAELRECVAYALTLLEPELRGICISIMDGESVSELARRHNMSRTGFRKIYFPRIREVFLAAGLGDF